MSRVNKKCLAQIFFAEKLTHAGIGGHSILFNLAVSTGHVIWSACPAVSKSIIQGEKPAKAGKYTLIE